MLSKGKLRFNWIEVHVSTHCNIKCKNCSHQSPYLSPRFYDLGQFSRDIRKLSEVCSVNLLWFIGGEPLLNSAIADYIKVSKDACFAKLHAVSTNGILIPKMKESFFDVVDYIFVALYPALSKLRPKLIAYLSQQSKNHTFNFHVCNRSYFYNIETDERLSDDVAQASYDNCDRVRKGQFVEDGHFYKCMRPVSTKEYLESRDYRGDIPDFKHVDGVPIHGPDLKERIATYMASKKHLESCHFCKMGLKDDSSATAWRKAKSYFEDVNFFKNIVYRHRRILWACHSLQAAFDKSFAKKARRNALDVGVPLEAHRLLTKGEYKSRWQAGG